MPKRPMTKSASSRIQSSQAKRGGDMSSSGFAARAQSAGDKWAAAGNKGGGAWGFTSSSGAGGNSNTRGSGGGSSCCVM